MVGGGIVRAVARALVALDILEPCVLGRHDWWPEGGRPCPRRPLDDQGQCSQVVYRCLKCPAYDYGAPGGPAYADCYTFGPCDSRECEPRAEILVDVDTIKRGIPTPQTTRLEHRQQ